MEELNNGGRKIKDEDFWPPCFTCLKPDLFDENIFIWEMYANILYTQYRSDGMGGFISTDYIVFKTRCNELQIDDSLIDPLWKKVTVIDTARRIEIKAEHDAANPPTSSASSKYQG